MVYDEDIGNKTIGDTHTHIDFPYKCKRCGRYVKIEDRFRWKHDCIPTSHWYDFFTSGGRVIQNIEPVRRPIRETYAKGYRHTIVNQNPFRNFLNWTKKLFK